MALEKRRRLGPRGQARAEAGRDSFSRSGDPVGEYVLPLPRALCPAQPPGQTPPRSLQHLVERTVAAKEDQRCSPPPRFHSPSAINIESYPAALPGPGPGPVERLLFSSLSSSGPPFPGRCRSGVLSSAGDNSRRVESCEPFDPLCCLPQCRGDIWEGAVVGASL